jgi:O-antigen/teichoic acid export membrane protein
MKKLFASLKNNGLARDNVIFFSASMLLNMIGFVYHAYMGRVLGPAEYGILGVMQAILYLLNVVLNVIQTAIARFVSTYKSKKDMSSTKYLFERGQSRAWIYGLVSLAGYILAGFFLIDFLNIPFKVYIYLGIIFPFVYLLALNRGILQGLQLFIGLGTSNVVEGVFKLAVGVSLVILGWKVGGAVLGMTASYVGAYIFSRISLKKYFSSHPTASEKKNVSASMFKYSIPVLITLLALTTLYSFDVFLVKHYLSGESAGFYAAASLIGKIVFFATLSIIMVMFPKVAESYENKTHDKTRYILNLSLMVMLVMCLSITGFYLLFPDVIILILFGKNYLPISSLLWLFALAYSMFSFIYAFSMYNLSVKRYSFIWMLVLVNILELILINLYHETLFEVLSMFSVSLLVLVVGLGIYTYSLHQQKT